MDRSSRSKGYLDSYHGKAARLGWLYKSSSGRLDENIHLLMDRPRAEVMGLSLNSSTSEAAEVDVQLWIDNPHSSAIDVVDIDFLVEEETEQQQFLVKKVQQAYAVQPHSSELVSVPLHLVYRDIVDDDESFQAGQVIPCSLRANINCRDAVNGVFKLSAQRIKHLFTVGEPSSSSRFEAPTGYVNGMDIVCVSTSKVDIQLVLRVNNMNILPMELLYTDFTLSSQEARLSKRVSSGVRIRGQASERLVIPFSVTFQELSAAGVKVTPGQLLPFKLEKEFIFKHRNGTSKIVQEKSGTIPVLQQPLVRLEAIVLEREGGRPVARLKLLVDNSHNPRISYVLTKAEYVVHEVSSGALVAKASWYDGADVKETDVVTVLELVAEEEEHPEFGASLWEAFTGNHTVYKPLLHLEAKSPEYGKLIFSP